MAFCTNCGKSLEEGARFCTNCGTPSQAASVATSAVAPIAAAPAMTPVETSTTVAEAPPPQTEISPVAEAPSPVPVQPVEASVPSPYTELAPPSSTSPVFVVVCVVLLVLIGGGIAGTIYIQKQGKAKAAPQTQSQTAEPLSQAPSTAPAGNAAPSSTSPAPTPLSSPSKPAIADSVRVMNLGNYPGSTPVAIATLTGETVVAGFLTRDTPQQVMQFYKVRFPISTTTAAEGKTELNATLPDGAHLRIHAEPQGGSTQVMILQGK